MFVKLRQTTLLPVTAKAELGAESPECRGLSYADVKLSAGTIATGPGDKK
jgi:hypothetical protein